MATCPIGDYPHHQCTVIVETEMVYNLVYHIRVFGIGLSLKMLKLLVDENQSDSDT